VTAEQARREFDAEVVWLPFDLHPEYPAEGIPLAELHRRYGIGVGERDPLRDRFAAAELEYDRPEIVSNTRLALRLTELARDRGLHQPFHDRLMDAYWSEATDIGDPDELRRLAHDLPADEVERVLTTDAYADRVHASTNQAFSVGVTGVPAWVIDGKVLVPGAQPRAVFEQAFAQLAG
jgi:predicted DsbA family dithiol-disulfide isomerase